MRDSTQKTLKRHFLRQVVRLLVQLLPRSIRRWVPDRVIRDLLEDAVDGRK